MGTSLPVLTYHAVTAEDGHGLDLFEAHLRELVRSGLRSLRPGELESARSGFLLTFDDGFADLWTHLLDLLESRGLHAMAFIVPHRTGDGPPRPRRVDVWQGTSTRAHEEAVADGSPHPAFLRWSELAALESTGHITVQSHSFAHRMGWVSDRMVGFNLRDGAHWSLAQATGGDTRLGIPLYSRGSAIGHRLFRDSPGLRDVLATWLEKQGGHAYIRARGRDHVADELTRLVRLHGREHSWLGEWETDEERRRRTLEDLASARETLERRLGGTRDELALPWGQYDQVTLACARQAGIRRVYTMDRAANPAGGIGGLVHRFRPRRRGPIWLRSRLWLHSSSFRMRIYRALSRSRRPS